MKHWASFVLLFPLAGCQDNRVNKLEKRVDQLEQTVHQLEADRTKAADDDSGRRAKLEGCVADANATFQTDMVGNGTKRVPQPSMTS